ncbi:hypothetical protein O0544_06625 [Edwardsiella anguillarum]|nr:hypothetical protein [Edwardsiella anguillarum]
MALYSLLPTLGTLGSVTLFVLAFCLIVSMYGGGFATVPAYLADLLVPRWWGRSMAAC